MSTPKHKPYENTKLEAVMNQATMAPKDLAKAAGLSVSAIGRALHWTSDKPVMLPSSIRKLCQALHRTPAEIGLDMYDIKINIAQAGAPHMKWSELPESKQPELNNFIYPKSEDEGLVIPKDIEDTEDDTTGKVQVGVDQGCGSSETGRVLIDAANGYVAGLTMALSQGTAVQLSRADDFDDYDPKLIGKNPDSVVAQPKADSDRAILTYEKQMYQALVDARAQVVLAQERYDVVRRLVTMLGIGEAATEQEGK
jgi:DNA-binding Xre family transcriptional regulator